MSSIIFLKTGETPPEGHTVIKADSGLYGATPLPVVAYLKQGAKIGPEIFQEFLDEEIGIHGQGPGIAPRVEIWERGALLATGLLLPGRNQYVQVTWTSSFAGNHAHGVSINGTHWEIMNGRIGTGVKYNARPSWEKTTGEGWWDPWSNTFKSFASGSSCPALQAMSEDEVVNRLLNAKGSRVVM